MPALLWAAVVWVIGGLETVPSFSSGVALDKPAHFGMYGVLGFLAARGWTAAGRPAGWLLPIALALLLGGADEFRQRAVPGRSAELADWIADAAGVTTGFLIALRLTRRRELNGRA